MRNAVLAHTLGRSMDATQFLTVGTLCERLGVPAVTARRWLRTGRLPALARLAAAVILGGDLGLIDPAWKGWKLTRGKIVSPENWDYTPGDVMSLTFERARARTYAAKLRYATQADFIEGRYVEPEETLAPDAAPQLEIA
jgi:hypothetical protein